MTTSEVETPPELEWLQLRNEFATQYKTEGLWEKMIRKSKENPFINIGCAATLGALSYGLWSFKQGNRQMSQYMMRARIVAQGFTIIAFAVGLGVTADALK